MQPEPRGDKLPGDCALAFPVCLDVCFFCGQNATPLVWSKCDAVVVFSGCSRMISFVLRVAR